MDSNLEALSKNSDIQILILPKNSGYFGSFVPLPLREKISYENQWEISIEYINKFQDEYKLI